MTTVTESDLRELKEFISGQFQGFNEKIGNLEKKVDNLEKKVDNLTEEVIKVRVDIANIKGELGGINKRLDNLEFTNRTIFVAIVGALFAGIIKLFFPGFPGNP